MSSCFSHPSLLNMRVTATVGGRLSLELISILGHLGRSPTVAVTDVCPGQSHSSGTPHDPDCSGEAAKRGALTADNPAEKANPPRLDLEEEDEIDPYNVEEIKAILVEAGKRRNHVRWAIALALGLRQGEALGLKWADIDLRKGVLKVRRSLNRPKYKHGCDDKSCGRHAGHCPTRQLARPQTSPTKSRAGRRTIGLPSELTEILQEHWKAQAAERVTARQLWKDEGWVFAKRTGEALSPNMDFRGVEGHPGGRWDSRRPTARCPAHGRDGASPNFDAYQTQRPDVPDRRHRPAPCPGHLPPATGR